VKFRSVKCVFGRQRGGETLNDISNTVISMISVKKIVINFYARLHTREKRQLASSCLSVRMEQLGSHWTDLREILYLRIFRKSVQKIQI
jgi:hypothetical protein